MARNYYNPDKGYELMANIIDREDGPYDETAREDIVHILKLCYIYTADEGRPNEQSAGELGKAILAYFAGGYGVPDFEQDSKEYWNPPAPATDVAPEVLPGLEEPH